MNYLAFHPDEIELNERRIVVRAARAQAQCAVEGLEIGQIRTLCIIGKGRFTVRCIEYTSSVVFEVVEEAPFAYPKKNVSVIVGLSRPQTVKKCIHCAATVGVKHLYFVPTARGEKSYITSKVFHEAELREAIALSVAQSGDPYPLMISVLPTFRALNEELTFDTAQKILFHTDSCVQESSSLPVPSDTQVIAFGPEAGWSDDEVRYFLDRGFTTRTLGPRILRVEVALGIGLGKLLF